MAVVQAQSILGRGGVDGADWEPTTMEVPNGSVWSPRPSGVGGANPSRAIISLC